MSSEDRTTEPRVCVFTTAHDTTDSRVVVRECRSLSDAGYDVTYYTPFAGECPVDSVSYGDVEPGVVPSIPDRLRWAVGLARRLARTDYDVYHFHDVELLPTGVVLGLLTDAPVIYDVHENVEDVLSHKPIFPAPIREPLAGLAATIEKGLSRFVDGIVAASPDIATRFPGHENAVTVTNYPRRTWAETTDPTPDTATATDREIRFVYCGLLSERRGIHTLVDAIERVPDEYSVSLVLGGKYAADEFRDRIETRASDSDRVELVGWLPSLADVIELFRDSDVGLMCFHPDPNKTDAVHRSNKLFQYMSAGLPTIVSDIGEWATLVEDVGCGVPVDPADPDAIAEVMCDLATDPERRTELGTRGHRAALERFNWDTERDRLLSLYTALGVEPPADREARTDASAPGSRSSGPTAR